MCGVSGLDKIESSRALTEDLALLANEWGMGERPSIKSLSRVCHVCPSHLLFLSTGLLIAFVLSQSKSNL